jgi:hypothetical protein
MHPALRGMITAVHKISLDVARLSLQSDSRHLHLCLKGLKVDSVYNFFNKPLLGGRTPTPTPSSASSPPGGANLMSAGTKPQTPAPASAGAAGAGVQPQTVIDIVSRHPAIKILGEFIGSMTGIDRFHLNRLHFISIDRSIEMNERMFFGVVLCCVVLFCGGL